MKRLLPLVGVSALVVTLAACGGSGGGGSSSNTTSTNSSPPTLTPGKLVVGFDVPAPAFWNGQLSGSTLKNPSGFEYGLALDVAKQLGTKVSIPALTSNAEQNMQLGSTYISDMLTRFGGSLPLAVAAYNAGPRRVDEWLAENGDPRTGKVDMLDWIELIPKNETRNYVQRVLENIVIYRARRGEMTPTLLAQWVLDRQNQ